MAAGSPAVGGKHPDFAGLETCFGEAKSQRRPAMNDIVLLNLRISMWGVSRVLPDHEYEVDADKAMVRATKKILECPEYGFLSQLKRSIHRRLKTLALPGEILRAGVYPVSAPMVGAVENTLEDFSVRWGAGVLGLEQVWDLRVREIEERLCALYDEQDYPSWERVRGCFEVRWNYFSMSTPQVLQAISGKLFVREQAKATVRWNEMLEEIRDGLRLTFKELVDALVDKLTPKPDGMRKKLVGVERLLEFLDTFSKKDVADDEQLRVLVEEVRGLMSGQDIAKLRKDQGVRELVQERMQSVKVVLDTLVEDAPARQIVLRD
jgi:hypothetical protein